jgi:hypothetical protein
LLVQLVAFHRFARTQCFVFATDSITTNLLCYNLKSDVFVTVITDGSKAPSFLDFCISESQFILWKPDAYWHMHNVTIKCPHCEKADPVQHKGWRKKPRRVCGNNTTYYLYSFEYNCKTCRKFCLLVSVVGLFFSCCTMCLG